MISPRLNSDEIARRLREMEIDIAIDLGGHTGLARLQIFAHRPAPVQASWLGYPGTTGAPFHRLSDRRCRGGAVRAPALLQREAGASARHLLSRRSGPRRSGNAPSRAEAGLPEDGFVFCCFNNSWKITRPVFDVWMRLLAPVPGSVLWLKQPARRCPRQSGTRSRAPRHRSGAAGLCRRRRRWRSIWRAIALADLFLDTLPYNAHATAADALWARPAGADLKGEAFAGRVAASLLQAVGLPELVTENSGGL